MSCFSQTTVIRNLLGPVQWWEQFKHCADGSGGGRSRFRRTWGWNKASKLGHQWAFDLACPCHEPLLLQHQCSFQLDRTRNPGVSYGSNRQGWTTEEAHQSGASLSENHFFLLDQGVFKHWSTLADRENHSGLLLSLQLWNLIWGHGCIIAMYHLAEVLHAVKGVVLPILCLIPAPSCSFFP